MYLLITQGHIKILTLRFFCSPGRLYALAGNRGEEKLQSVDCYDPDSGSWRLVSPIPLSKLYGPSAVGINGAIFLIATIGGLDSSLWHVLGGIC